MYANPNQFKLMMGQFMPMLLNGATSTHRSVGNDAEKLKAVGIGKIWKILKQQKFVMFKFHLKSIILDTFVQSNKLIFNFETVLFTKKNRNIWKQRRGKFTYKRKTIGIFSASIIICYCFHANNILTNSFHFGCLCALFACTFTDCCFWKK